MSGRRGALSQKRGALFPYDPANQWGDVLAYQAKQQFPILKDVPVDYRPQDVPQDVGMLETYPPGETERPAGLPIDQLGVSIFDPNTTPKDVLADVVSHGLRFSDPQVRDTYNGFAQSITPKQRKILDDQYKWYATNAGESRPFNDWAEISGIPAYFRGYTFDQWPQSAFGEMYTPDQMTKLDALKKYLGLR